MSIATKIVCEIMILMNLTLTFRSEINTFNFFDITKMTKIFDYFKNYLKLLSPEEQLYEINLMVNEFNKSNRNGEKS